MSTVYTIHPPQADRLEGTIRLNGSKSISNRVLIIDALCGHQIALENLSNADDTVFLQRLLASDDAMLDAGAGGTTYRFLTAFLATQEGREVVLTGSERMQQRPIRILVDALRQLGADISYEKNEHFPPLRIKGKKLKGGKVELPADTSSQYITALLLIAPTLEDGLELSLMGTIVSIPYIRMTLRMMEYFGVKTYFEGNVIRIAHAQYLPRPFFVEGDWSAASYFYSAAILSEEATLTLEGLTAQQIQGDSVIADIAKYFGVTSHFQKKSVTICKENSKQVPSSFGFDFLECPDLAQTVLAFCGALGVSLECKGLQTLRIKETDRIAAMDTELQRLGLASLVEINSHRWDLQYPENVVGNPKESPVHTYEDHRMAMAIAPLCLVTKEIKMEDPMVVTKSYPLFWKDLGALGFQIKD